jgi:hypothetical protein
MAGNFPSIELAVIVHNELNVKLLLLAFAHVLNWGDQ